MSLTKKQFGTLSTGEDVSLYALESGEYRACWSDYGASWLSLVMPDSRGRKDDVVLGFSSFTPYAAVHPHFGATVGRFANRIAGAKFSLDGKDYGLHANNGANHLHGGRRGFGRRLWRADIATIGGEPALRFSLDSADGEEGYPGNLCVSVTVTLNAQGELGISYEAESDRRTPVNLTNHAYFNLSGEGAGTIAEHELMLRCSHYLPVDAALIPLPGKPTDVSGTAFDFRKGKRIGADLGPALLGYDHCFVIDSLPSGEPFAVATEKAKGRKLTVTTTSPAVQFYTGNHLNGIMGKGGSVYERQSAFCLETQYYPDTPNRPDYPSCYAEPGKKWAQSTQYCFSVL
ncbi:MAG TPA: aldose epimerase family protein [Rectinemataceae bacterium]|nr:aldose epimerase family protein [Rectinemataceae bacterium]